MPTKIRDKFALIVPYEDLYDIIWKWAVSNGALHLLARDGALNCAARCESRGHMLADVPALLGSMDIVFGEVDR